MAQNLHARSPHHPQNFEGLGAPKWLKTGVLKQNQICIGSHHIYTRIPLHINSMIPSHKIRYIAPHSNW